MMNNLRYYIKTCVVLRNSHRRVYKNGKSYSSYPSETLAINFETGDLILNTGKMARMSDSSAVGNINETHVLTTVVTNKKNRSIRPLFPKSANTEVQIVCNLLSFDGQQNPDVVCVNTVSYALHKSHLLWNGPIGCVRVGIVDSKLIVNPTRKQLETSPLNLIVTANLNSEIVMLEGWADNLNQEKFIDALKFGVHEAHRVSRVIKESVKHDDSKSDTEKIDKTKDEIELKKVEVYNELKKMAEEKLIVIYKDYLKHDKKSRDDAVTELRNNVLDEFKNKLTADSDDSSLTYGFDCFNKLQIDVFRELLLNEPKRCDGREVNEVRPIESRVGMFKNLHGSALFQRGQTQVLCTVTFDSLDSMYKSDRIVDMVSPSLTNFNKNFMLHYEFPPYATNEIGRISGQANRREIGHGALAEKAIYPVIPADTPFTIRLLCEVLESNGSSSMASVCAGSMALLDAGIEIAEPVCGVAMGLVTKTDTDNKIIDYKVLTDIMGMEDYLGDMDFKIAGTKHGITAIQADVKLSGLPFKIAREAIEKSSAARLHILDKMNSVISGKRTNDTKLPIIKEIEIPANKRSRFIGVGGVNIKKIESTTGVKITVLEENRYNIFAPNSKQFNEAEKLINKLIEDEQEPKLEFGNVYTAKIVEVVQSGVMVKLYPSMKPVLLHNNQLDSKKIMHGSASGLVSGQEIQVKYFGLDPVTGAMRLSRKVLFMTSSKSSSLFKNENVKTEQNKN